MKRLLLFIPILVWGQTLTIKNGIATYTSPAVPMAITDNIPSASIKTKTYNVWVNKSSGIEMPPEWSPIDKLYGAWRETIYDSTGGKIEGTYIYHEASTKQDSLNFIGLYERKQKTIKSVDSQDINNLILLKWNLKTNTVSYDTITVGVPDTTNKAPFSINSGNAYSRMLAGDATARVSSSKEKKKGIADLVVNPSLMVGVKAKTYKYSDGKETHSGFIAEEINPLLGNGGSDEVDYNKVITTLWEIVRQQQIEIQALKLKVK